MEQKKNNMESNFEKKLKAFLPYIIIIGVVYLIVPALLFLQSDFISYLVLIGFLPLTAGGCCAHYSMNKENDFWLCLVAPAFFVPAMFLYPIFRTNALVALIYLVSYLLCGYLGLTIGEIVSSKGKVKNKRQRAAAMMAVQEDDDDAANRVSVPRSVAQRPERVDVGSPDAFVAEDPDADGTLDTSTTTEDIDAILSEIHQRRGSDL